MKSKLLIPTFILGVFTVVFAQFGQQQIISTATDTPYLAIPADIDADGITDVLTASGGGHYLSWYKNDGLGNFGVEQVITNEPAGFSNVDFVDLDSDGDNDLIYTETNPPTIVWQENLDGMGTFGPRQIILQDITAYTVAVGDIDNDGDLDIFANLYEPWQNRISWFENTGQGVFSSENIIETGEFYGDGGGSKILVFDIDNDGDNDVITSYESYQPSQIIWYENTDGQGTLAASQLIYQYFNMLSDWMSIFEMRQADINADGNSDIVVTGYFDDYPYSDYVFKLEWLENLNASGQFSNPQNIAQILPKTMFVYDLDGDGDDDILATITIGPNSTIFWYKNTDGQGSFSGPQTVSTEIENIKDARAADIDGDGLLDVISASTGDNKLSWYKNEFLSTPSFSAKKIILYPNPVLNQLFVQSQIPVKKIVIKNNLGQEVISKNNPTSLELSSLNPGVYIALIETQDGNTHSQKIIKQ